MAPLPSKPPVSSSPAVWQGEPWRLLTAAMLHGSVLHFALNITALFVLGKVVAKLGHGAHVSITFLFSALTGSAASTLLLPDDTSVGASGGLLGLLGYLAVFSLRRGQALPSRLRRGIVLSVVLTAALGIVAREYIDNAAHAGGFLGGLIAGAALIEIAEPVPAQPGAATRYVGAFCTTVLLATAALSMLKIAGV